MTHPDSNNIPKLDEILEKLNSLDKRLFQVESSFQSHKSDINDIKGSQTISNINEEETSGGILDISELVIENKLGEFGLALIGNIVLLFGLTFLTQYIQNKGYPALSSILGYFSVLCVIGFSYFFRKSFRNLSFMFNLLGQLLLYYFTFRLHFISDTPLISDKMICVYLLLLVNILQFYLSMRQKSTILGGIAIILTLITGILSHSTHFMLSVNIAIAAVSVYSLYRFGWRTLLMFSQILVYFSILIWFLGNPFMRHAIEIAGSHQFSYIYLFSVALIYSILMFVPKKDSISNEFITGTIILNGLGFSLILLLMVLKFFETNYIWIFISIFVLCFPFSIILKSRSPWKSSHALYALYSFISLSVAVYGIYEFPDAFLLLSIESLLVVSIALLFRSKLIVILNIFLYIFLLLTYFVISEPINYINFSFAIIALTTARIINWQKGRLDIKSELLRNVYLVIGFIMLLFSLYKAVPENYITLSWVCTALLYFIMSLILRNVKYRWMAIFTFIFTAFYLFIVDLASIDLVYRVITFLTLAIISIIISIIYTKRIKKQNIINI